jgi:hypothetical protein
VTTLCDGIRMNPTPEELDWILQRLVAKTGAVPLSWLRFPTNDSTRQKIKQIIDVDVETDATQYFRSVWSLVHRGLAFVGMESNSPSDWRLCLTGRGYDSVNALAITPEDPTGYMERLLKEAPKTSAVVQMYMREALRSYTEGCYLSSTVMLGVAAEACMLETATDYVRWAGDRAGKFAEILVNPRHFYVFKLQEFQKRLIVEKTVFPPRDRRCAGT